MDIDLILPLKLLLIASFFKQFFILIYQMTVTKTENVEV